MTEPTGTPRRQMRDTPDRVRDAAQRMSRIPPSGNGYSQENNRLPLYRQQMTNEPYGQYPQQQFSQQKYTAQPRQAETGHTGRSAAGLKINRTWVAAAALILIAVILIAVLSGGSRDPMSEAPSSGKETVIPNGQTEQQTENTYIPEESRALFCEGVYVDGISLGGMTPEQAKNAVLSQISQRYFNWEIRLFYQGQDLGEPINKDTVGMTVDIGTALQQAYDLGHTGDEEQQQREAEELKTNPRMFSTEAPRVNGSAIDAIISRVKKRIDTPVQTAATVYFDHNRPDHPFTIEKGAAGRALNEDAVRQRVYDLVSRSSGENLELESYMMPVSAEETAEGAEKLYALRAAAETPISSTSPDERNQNIELALDKINGTILKPGEKFSFNGTVGERTAKNKFQVAKEYAYGDEQDGIGGGVCQASTTVYLAAVRAGLEILKREPHSMQVSYTGYGMDATVAWAGRHIIDLEFRNNTENNIYIMADLEKNKKGRATKAKVWIYGMDLGDIRYEIETEETEEPAPTEPKYIKDQQGKYVTYTDEEKSVKKARPGCTVYSYRAAYIGRKLIERIPLNGGKPDIYEPKPEEIYVGVTPR